MDLITMQAKLKDASLQYRKAQKSHAEHRLHFLESSDSKHCDCILQTEEQRRQGRIAKRLSGKLMGGSVTNILHSTPHQSGADPILCNSKASLESALLQVNQAKYQQCGNSPFLLPPLKVEFGYLHSPAVSAVLNGTYIPPPDTDPYAKLLITQMAQTP